MDTVAWAVLAFVTLTDQSRNFDTLCPKCHSEFEQVDPKYAAMRDIECPRCAQTMLAMVDKDQYHIKFEAYPVCYGIFSMPVNSNTPKNTLYWNASSR